MRVRRLHQTIGAMLALTFGPAPRAAAAAARINAIHDRVHGVLPEGAGAFPAGTRYSAHDPALLRWVHATLLDSLPATYELFVGPLTASEKNEYCMESKAMGPRLGMPEDQLPGSTSELQEYMQRMLSSSELAVTRTSRELAREVLFPPLGAAVWPLAHVNRLATIGLLPSSLREAYGFRWSDSDEAALHRYARAIRAVRRFLPPVLAHWRASRVSHDAGRASSMRSPVNP